LFHVQFVNIQYNSGFQVDVDGLTVAVSSVSESVEDPSKTKAKGKSKSKAEARELISDAHLRLKAGVHYGLIGRNGTGKSSL
jgi:ABC-type polysaccharide/polyol phosphate transport system ATPase subunit